MVRTKVFVGNLSFKTTDKDLAKEFEVAGKVATANIISRGSRSLGYGFVEMESEEEAKRSVELLNKKTIDSREINVEVARPREERPPAPAAAEGSSPAAGDATTRSPARRGRGRGGNKRPAGASSGSPASPAPAGGDVTAAPSAAPKKRAPRKKPTGEVKADAGAATGDASSPAPAAPRRARTPRAPRNDAERTPSKSTLFVANLPFTVDDTQLADLFKGLNIKAAHVVRKPNNNAKSKGFGFVEFNNEEDQLKALEAVNKKFVEGRELSVKIALAEPIRAESVRTDTAGDVTPAAALPATTAPGVAATAESK